MNQLCHFTEKYYFLFLFIYIFFLPIAHTAAIQSIVLVLFLIFFLFFEFKRIDYKSILTQKKIIFIFIGLLFLALLSLHFTPNIDESLKEIQHELIRNFCVMFLFFYYITLNPYQKIKILLAILSIILLFHTITNIIVWFYYGGYPVRAGGLLDGGPGFAGERFGIWATYALAFSMGLLLTQYKKLALFFLALSVFSIIANNTRATYVSTVLIVSIYFLFFVNNRKLKIILFSACAIFLLIFYNFSENLTNRFNVKNTILNAKLFLDTPISNYNSLDEKGLDHSITSRIAMWRSVFIYRAQEPFIPAGYGRFLYADIIKEKFKNEPNNIPPVVYPQTHNEFVGYYCSLGLIGLLLFIYFLYLKLSIAYKLFHSSKETNIKVFSFFIFFGTIGMIGSLMFGSFFGDTEAKLFYCLYGILIGIYYKEYHETLPSTSA